MALIAEKIEETSARIHKIKHVVDKAGSTNQVLEDKIDEALDSIQPADSAPARQRQERSARPEPV
jgi:hypothetical protein